MSHETFRALYLTREEKETRHEWKELTDEDLPEGEVLVRVDYTSLNYKDALAVTGKGPVVRSFPMVPGIDLAGTVLESNSPAFAPGDEVLLTGYGVGESHWGGFAERARVRAEWLLPRPAGLTARSAMAVGTAGLTAMLCVSALLREGLEPDDGEVLVTGAAGGVGSVAVSILSSLGYRVSALVGPAGETGRRHAERLGAEKIADAPRWADATRPLEKQLWAGAVDTVGAGVLARTLAETRYEGTVSCCGLAGGPSLPATVMPFILRGVTLKGIDSVFCPANRRAAAWERIARDLPAEKLDALHRVAPLSEVPRLAEEMLAGNVLGRVVFDNAP